MTGIFDAAIVCSISINNRTFTDPYNVVFGCVGVLRDMFKKGLHACALGFDKTDDNL